MPSGGGSSNTQPIQKSDPWGPAQGNLQDILNQASYLDQNAVPQYYGGGPQVAGLPQGEQGAIDTAMGTGTYAAGAGTNAFVNGANGLGGVMQGGGVNQALPFYQGALNTAQGLQSGATGQAALSGSNAALAPFLNGSMASANNPYFQQMAATTLGNVMPGIQASFTSGGRMDSGLATRAASLGANDAIGQLAYNNYQTGLQQQLTAAQQSAANAGTQLNSQLSGAQLASGNYNAAQQQQIAAGALGPSYFSGALSGLGGTISAGGTSQQNQQAMIDAAMKNWNYNQTLPWQQLQTYLSMVQPISAGGGGQTTSSPYFTNPLASGLSTGIGGLALGNAAFGTNGLLSNSAATGLFDSGGLFGAGAALAFRPATQRERGSNH